jgi:3-hydroxyacyl-[acyl-carrier-protein] dehydratase
MLMNDFFTYQDAHKEDSSFSCKVAFNKEHDIFKGHFPGQPVVPGVCMMEMVREFLQQAMGKKLWLRNAGNVKFLQLITPDIQPFINISWKESEAGYNVNASFKNDASDLFKLSGNFEIS